ncbi:oxalate:formate antiporter [Plakobranchus ocellatus]|uniref:Oxalate:formate antiporter n=1 Tax=Plakobranchus ocellatus TaxID=259542 RepID=A0AAV3ZBH6_9GAST|nr:oxalate:formate antiporter [Plakobranchus ocellatus]
MTRADTSEKMLSRRETCVKYCSIVGAHLVMAPFSFIWVYGNLSAYTDSFIRFSCYPRCTDCDSQWILGLYLACICPGVLITKTLEKRLGLKYTGVSAMVLCGLALLGSAWVLPQSVAWTAVLLGIMLGIAVGVVATVTYQIVGGWAPEKFALFMATTTGTPTALSMIENQLITAYVNPQNLKPDANIGPRTFFSQPEILTRVPTAIRVFGALTVGLQLLGYLMITNPPKASPGSLLPNDSNDDKSNKLENMQENSNAQTSFEASDRETIRRNPKSYGSNKEYNETSDTSNETPLKSDLMESVQQSALDTVENQGTDAPQGKTIPKSFKPSETVKTLVFYAVFLYALSILYGLILKSNFYKQFGLLYIHNDRYLTLVGTLIPVVSTVSRIFFGVCLDKGVLSMKDSVILSLALNTILCTFWYFAPQVHAVLYMALVLGLAAAQGAVFVILPTAARHVFGPDDFSSNYGLLIMTYLVVGILAPVVVTPLLHALGWFWLFASVGFIGVFTLVLVIASKFDV